MLLKFQLIQEFVEFIFLSLAALTLPLSLDMSQFYFASSVWTARDICQADPSSLDG